MKIAPILLLLVLPGSAWASDSAAGGIAFQQACSRCHSARQTPNPEAAHGQSLGALKREAHAGPDLSLTLLTGVCKLGSQRSKENVDVSRFGQNRCLGARRWRACGFSSLRRQNGA